MSVPSSSPSTCWGRPWTALILNVLQAGPLRFSELAEAAGPRRQGAVCATQGTEGRGLVERSVEPDRPVRVSYQLTDSRSGIPAGRVSQSRSGTVAAMEAEPAEEAHEELERLQELRRPGTCRAAREGVETRNSLQRVDEAEHLLHECGFATSATSRRRSPIRARRAQCYSRCGRAPRILLERTLGDLALRVVAGQIKNRTRATSWDQLPYVIRHTEGACSFFRAGRSQHRPSDRYAAALDPSSPHDVEALDDSAFALDIRA